MQAMMSRKWAKLIPQKGPVDIIIVDTWNTPQKTDATSIGKRISLSHNRAKQRI